MKVKAAMDAHQQTHRLLRVHEAEYTRTLRGPHIHVVRRKEQETSTMRKQVVHAQEHLQVVLLAVSSPCLCTH